MSAPTTTTASHGGGAGLDSWALVQAAQAGDREAFAQLYCGYAPHITRYLARRLAGDRGLVEDLTQETFLRAWRRIDSVADHGRDVGAWFVTIARNLAADHHKSARQRYERTFAELPVPRYDDGSEASAERRVLDQAGRDTEASAERQVLDRLDRQSAASTVRRCLAGLSADQRAVIECYEQPVKTIAAAMGRSPSAVKALRHRAVQAMARQLADQGVSSSQQCYEAVAAAQQAVRDLHSQSVTRPAPVDRWAGGSLAAAVGVAL